ncbi:MAG: hypothetical protein LQ340_005649 [Diploschistes diacapsis]|nr:MAG: hypothetical protein LQ340_005649 [Diploschistes diacapsis]
MAAAAKTLVLVTGVAASALSSPPSLLPRAPTTSFSARAVALSSLHSRYPSGSAEVLHLDVTDDSTISAAVEHVRVQHNRLDTLINNAAVAKFDATLRQQMRLCFDTNATGPAVVVDAFAPLLKTLAAPKFVNIASGRAASTGGWSPARRFIKLRRFVEYKPLGFKVHLFDPGFTVSNLGPHNTEENGAKPVGDAVGPLIEIIEGKRDDEDGKLLHNTGVYPW